MQALAWAYIGPAHPLAAFEGVSPPGLLALGGQCVALLAAIVLASVREWRLRKAGVDSSVQVRGNDVVAALPPPPPSRRHLHGSEHCRPCIVVSHA